MPYFGAHESVSKGLHLAFDRIAQAGGECLQIFTRNQRQWYPKPLDEDEIERFAARLEENKGMVVASHASYLVNLASDKKDMLKKSVEAFAEELKRCHLLSIPYVVLHPGSHGGAGTEAGLDRFVKGLDNAFEIAEADVMVLVETTAGQGTGLGSSFQELGYIRSSSKYSDKIGVCLDTCHVFAAGYDICSPEGYRSVMDEFDREVGIEHLKFFHLNDSKKERGSRVDRHEHIGAGCIGLEGFRNIVNDARFAHHPMALETPKGDDLEEDRENLAVLRSLVKT